MTLGCSLGCEVVAVFVGIGDSDAVALLMLGWLRPAFEFEFIKSGRFARPFLYLPSKIKKNCKSGHLCVSIKL